MKLLSPRAALHKRILAPSDIAFPSICTNPRRASPSGKPYGSLEVHLRGNTVISCVHMFPLFLSAVNLCGGIPATTQLRHENRGGGAKTPANTLEFPPPLFQPETEPCPTINPHQDGL